MTKATAIDGVIKSAIEEFARLGYMGASLRDIAAHAGVPLSTIHRYFGNKEDLYLLVNQRVWDEINGERDVRLQAALATPPPKIEDLMRALVEPVVLRVFASDNRRQVVDLLRLSPPLRRALGIEGPVTSNYNAISRRWIAAIKAALPAIPGDMLVWGFSFAVGSLYSWQLLDHLYDDFLPHERELSAAEITEALVAFASGGLRSLQPG